MHATGLALLSRPEQIHPCRVPFSQTYLVSVATALSLVISDVSQLGAAASNLQTLYSVSVAVDTNGK